MHSVCGVNLVGEGLSDTLMAAEMMPAFSKLNVTFDSSTCHT